VNINIMLLHLLQNFHLRNR